MCIVLSGLYMLAFSLWHNYMCVVLSGMHMYLDPNKAFSLWHAQFSSRPECLSVKGKEWVLYFMYAW